jgi:UDP-glucose 4-epimerase
VFNLGNGDGFSVKEVITAAMAVTERFIALEEGFRRAGDPAILIGSATKARKVLGWNPQYSDIGVILEHAWQWHQHRHGV